MIDEKMIALVKETKAKLDGMKDARPSERMAIKEAFAVEATAIAGKALLGIRDAYKIAFFDSLAKGEIENLVKEIEERASGEHSDDGQSDYDHGVVEEVRQAVFGRKISEATNEFEDLLG